MSVAAGASRNVPDYRPACAGIATCAAPPLVISRRLAKPVNSYSLAAHRRLARTAPRFLDAYAVLGKPHIAHQRGTNRSEHASSRGRALGLTSPRAAARAALFPSTARVNSFESTAV